MPVTDETIEKAAEKMIAGKPLSRREQRLLESPMGDCAMGQVRAALEARGDLGRSKSSLIGEIVVLQGDVARYRERCTIKDAEIARLRAEIQVRNEQLTPESKP